LASPSQACASCPRSWSSFGSQAYDRISLLLLAIAAAGTVAFDAVRAQIPRVANGPSKRVTSLEEGLAALKAGKTIAYDGASSSVDIKPDGSLAARDFELYEIRGGRHVAIERVTSAS
jgi:branched-chain amino acid transport system substrate-binding protein